MERRMKFQGPGTDLVDRFLIRLAEMKAAPDGILEKVDIRKKQGQLVVRKSNTLNCPFSAYSHQVLDLLIIELTEQNGLRSKSDYHLTVTIPLHTILEYMAIPQTKASRDETVKRLKKEMELLSSISLAWVEIEKNNGKEERKSYDNVKPISGWAIKKGTLIATFGEKFGDYLINSHLTSYPAALLKLGNRDATAYFVGKKLAYHAGLKNNINKGSNECISVRALLASVPTIPTIDEVDADDPGHWRRRILEPFEKALDKLSKEGFITWSYCGRGRSKIDDLDGWKSNIYSFQNLYINFKVKL